MTTTLHGMTPCPARPYTDLCNHEDRDDCGSWETVDGEFVCGTPVDRVCDECRDSDGERLSWPCNTIRVLDGEA